MAFVEVLPTLSLSCIDLRNQNVICLSDLSTYESIPSSSYLAMQITPPGYPTINVSFVPGNVNIYKCADVGINCVDSGCTPMPDGIYSVIYTVNPEPGQTFTSTSIDQKFIKIDTIRCKYQRAFGKLDIKCMCTDPSQMAYWQQLRTIKLYIDGSVTECLNCNYTLSYEMYHKADLMLDKLCAKFPKMQWTGIWRNYN